MDGMEGKAGWGSIDAAAHTTCYSNIEPAPAEVWALGSVAELLSRRTVSLSFSILVFTDLGLQIFWVSELSRGCVVHGMYSIFVPSRQAVSSLPSLQIPAITVWEIGLL